MTRMLAVLMLTAALPVSAAVVVPEPETRSLARAYSSRFFIEQDYSSPLPTSADVGIAHASATYGRLNADGYSPFDSVGGRAGSFGQAWVSDTLYLDFRAGGLPTGPISLSIDFTVTGVPPVLTVPGDPADAGWLTARALWNLSIPRHEISGDSSVYRYYFPPEDRDSFVTVDGVRTNRPAFGDFSFTVPYDPRGHRIALVPLAYDLYCGGGFQRIKIPAATATCSPWSLAITGIHVLDADGGILTDVIISAASRYDYNGSGLPIEPPSLVPEPAVWGLMIIGFGLAGLRLRRTPLLLAATTG